jgi:cell division topological specificity factor
MLEFFMRLFRGESSGQTAKERLRLVLLSDHLALAPEVVEALKTDLLQVISRYVEVDEAHVDVTFEQREHEVAMLANIPIRSLKERPSPPALASVTPLPVAEPVAVASEASSNGAAGGGEAAAEVPAEATPAKPRKRRRRRAARAAVRAQAEPAPPVDGAAPVGNSAQA